MTRLAAFIIVFLPIAAQAHAEAHAQDSGAEIQDMASEPENNLGDEEIEGAEYYVVEDGNDTWPDEALSEEQYAVEDSAPYSMGDPMEMGLREPPGLPLVEAQPASGEMVRRSLGGARVRDAAAPWQAQIYYPKVAAAWNAQLAAGEQPWVLQHYCGGALVAPDWVLTAAHCIDEGMMRAGYRVRLGQERIDLEGGWTFKIDKVIRNPEYKPLKGGDIALIHITKDQQQADPPPNQVRPIALFRGADAMPAEPVTAFGWGRVSNTGNRSNAVMLKVGLNIVDRPSCDKARVALVDSRVVCAAAPGRKTCSNDSGGPLVNAASQLVGLVSAGGKSCADDGVPGVYTRVGAYLPWITQATGGAVR
jgi:trypsin